MLVKTHASVGIATALFIQPPTTFPMLGAAIAISAIGGTICDIDSSRSKAKKSFDKLIGLLFMAVLIIFGMDYFYGIGIKNYILSNDGIIKTMCAVFMMLLICFYGSGQPHRGFMHSFACCFLLSAVIAALTPTLYLYFCAAFTSHIAIDFLNKKREQLLWPLKWGGCLNICKSDGIINNILFFVGIIMSVYTILASSPINSAICSYLSFFTHK